MYHLSSCIREVGEEMRSGKQTKQLLGKFNTRLGFMLRDDNTNHQNLLLSDSTALKLFHNISFEQPNDKFFKMLRL